MDTRVSLKQALKSLGFQGGNKHDTELNQWMNHEKEVLAGTVSYTHLHKKFTAQVYVLTKDEGGRHTPFFNNYRPQFYFRTTDVTGAVSYTHLDVYKRQHL